jgi:hypothetical protein
MRPARRLFDSSEDRFIRSHYRSMPIGDLARHLDRKPQQVRKRASKIGASEPLKRWGPAEDETLRLAWGHERLAAVARRLGRCEATVSERTGHLGLRPWRKRSVSWRGRPIDGFRDGVRVFTHRRVVEERIGRSLRSDEIVHHIDGNKANNAPDNLHLFASRSAHCIAHSTLGTLIPTLLERGIIEFDRTLGLYRLCEIHK